MAVKMEEEFTKNESHMKVLNDPDFKKLRAARVKIVAVLTILTLITYYGYILLLAYGKNFLSTKVSASITMGLPIGVLVIVVSWILTYYYARWANKTYDHKVDEIKSRMGG